MEAFRKVVVMAIERKICECVSGSLMACAEKRSIYTLKKALHDNHQ
jgi:hypothetical protein